MSRFAFRSLLLTALNLVCGATALGQSSNSTSGGPQQYAPGNTQRTAAKRPEVPQDAAPVSIGVLMQQNGGSLLQAAILATPDPNRAKLADVSLFAVPDPSAKTIKKHDLVTIVVNEVGQNTSAGDTTLSKQSDFDAKLANFVALNLGAMKLKGFSPSVAPELNFTGTRDFKGDAAVDRSDTLTDRVTAEVIDVKPNNTLILQARKRIKTDDEEQEFIMSGICRVEDVTADNTILSSQCYDLALEKNTRGMVRETTKRGGLTKFLDWLNPF